MSGVPVAPESFYASADATEHRNKRSVLKESEAIDTTNRVGHRRKGV
jgi:hypothetical protein